MPSISDDHGIPTAGSALQLAYFVNCAPDVLAAAIGASGGPASIDWRSPRSEKAFTEHKDTDFLAAVGQSALASALADWWPPSGPRWDALGVSTADDGVVLVEAKANIPEIANGPGCGSGSSGSTQGQANREQIADALKATRAHYGIAEDVASTWMDTHCYQYANRLAHLCFFEQQGVPATLAHVYFVNDVTYQPTAAGAFDEQRATDRAAMGLQKAAISGAVAVHLPAVPTAYERLQALAG